MSMMEDACAMDPPSRDIDSALRAFEASYEGALREDLGPDPLPIPDPYAAHAALGTGNGRNGAQPQGEEIIAPQANGHRPPASAEVAVSVPLVTFEELAARPRVPQRFLIEGLVPAEEALLISGRERSFKSFLTMEWALSLALRRKFLGCYGVEDAGIVLLLDLENRAGRLCDRVEAALRRDGLRGADLRGRLLVFDRDNAPGRWRFTAQSMAALEILLERYHPALVVVDNVRKATPPGKDEREGKDMLPIMDTMVEMCEAQRAALVLVHHDRRDGSGASGSGALLSTPGNVIQIKHDRATRVSVVTCDSMRNAEPFAPFAITVARNGALRAAEMPEGDGVDDERPDHGPAIIKELRSGGKSVGELCAATGLTARQVRYALKALVVREEVRDTGQSRQTATGKPAAVYGLAAQGSTEA